MCISLHLATCLKRQPQQITPDATRAEHMLSLALCQRVPWSCALPASEHFLANLLWQRAAFRVVFVPSLHYPCYGDVFYHSGFLTQSRETSAAARGFAVPRAVVLQIQHAPHGVALQLSSAAAVPCLSRIPADVVWPYVYAIQLRGTTHHRRGI